jgi:hypothetical protein
LETPHKPVTGLGEYVTPRSWKHQVVALPHFHLSTNTEVSDQVVFIKCHANFNR